MRKKSILLGLLTLGALLTLASCDNKEIDDLKSQIESLKSEKEDLETKNNGLEKEKSDLEKEKEDLNTKNADLETKNNSYKNGDCFTIKYTDFLGKTKTNTYLIGEYDTVLDALKANNKVDVSYGWINSINDSFNDYNWSAMIYENGKLGSGINDLHIDAGDVFDFKFECWNTIDSEYGGLFDKYDVLVDQVIYNYAINKLGKKLENVNTWDGSTFWDSMLIYIALKNGYDSNVFNKDVFNTTYQQSLTTANIENSVSTAVNNYFKYYYSARLFDLNLDNLKTLYGNYLESLTSYDMESSDYYAPEYSLPFLLSAAKTLGLDNKIASATKTTSYRPDLTWGAEGYAWFLAGYASYNTIDDSDLAKLTFDALESAYQKDVAISTYLLAYAASNKNVRTLKNSNDVDLIQYLFDTYFDYDNFVFDAEKADNDMSSNQIYAALLAYKIQRDKNSATILFE